MENSTVPPHILVAEDDKLYAKVYQNKLTKEGYQVTVVNNGNDAIKKASEIKPSLILLDLIMPEMDGFEVLKRMKSNPETKSIHVLVMSNLGQDTDIAKAKDLGAEDYFVKSNVSITELMEKIKSYVGQGVKKS